MLRWLLFGLFCGGAIFFAVTGRILVAIPLALVALSFIRRWKYSLPSSAQSASPSSGQKSEVETFYLKMALDHDTGAVDGTVLRGEFEGQKLSELDLGDVLKLLSLYRQDDPQSGALIETFLDRIYGDSWRESNDNASHVDADEDSGLMTHDEALHILGLKHGATIEEIKRAHHRLMLKIHPDKGGSTYLASKINQAKELLLG